MAGINRTTDKATDLITFSRASVGTYLDSDGLLKTASTNVPRIEYDAAGNVKGLLIEEARTNLVTYSEDFSTWALSNCTVSSNSEVAPDGNSTADTLSFSSVDGLCRFIGPSCSVGETYTNSIWLKAGTATSIKLVILFSGGGLGLTSSTLSLTNDWQRFDITATVPAGTPDEARLRLQSTEIGTVHVWGAQIEEGSFPTSYIPTSGATATRAADIASISVDNFGYNQKAGTVVVEFETVATTNATAFNLAKSSDASGLIERCQVRASNGDIDYLAGSNGLGPFDATGYAITSVGPDPSTPVKAAVFIKKNDTGFIASGSLLGSDTTNFVVPDTDELRIGRVGGLEYTNGHIKSIAYYPRRLSNAQLQELTA